MKRKLWLLIVVPLILSLFISSVNASDTFGYTTKGGSYGTLTNRIKGSKYYLSELAYAQNITVYLKMNDAGGTGKTRCAIYKTDLSLLAVTEELTVPQDFDGWKTFNFTSPPLLSVGYYWLVAWANTPTSGEFRVYKTANSSNQQVYQIETYTGTFPNPLGEGEYFGYYPYNMSIYCMYIPWTENGPPPPPPPNGNGNGADINILNMPLRFGDRLGISTFSAGMLLTALFIFPLNLILVLWKKGGVIALILNLTFLGLFASMSWLPIWTIVLIVVLIIGIQGFKMKGIF